MSNMKNIIFYRRCFMRYIARATALALTGLLLSGCWHTPIASLPRLSRIDAAAVNPSELRLAARAPDWLEAAPGHVHLKATLHAGEADEKEMVFDLVDKTSPADLRALSREAQAGSRFTVFAASAADAARIGEIQTRARDEKAAGARHKGKLQLYAEPCRRGDPPPGPAMVDLYLKLGADEDFFKIYEGVDLRDPAMLGGELETVIPLCGKLTQRAK
jgi:hypothetical protein